MAPSVPVLRLPGILLISLAGAIAALVAISWHDLRATVQEQTAAVERLGTRVDELESAVQLFRLEQSVEGKGVEAVLARLRTYGPLMAAATMADPTYRDIEAKIEEALRAVEELGESAWPALHEAFLASRAGKDSELRRWLLEAMFRADRRRTMDFAVRVLRADDPEIDTTQRLRWIAADMLIERDRQRAGAELRQILLTESSRGPNPNLPGANLAASASQHGFHNFVARYLRTGDPRTEETLLQILGKPVHDRITKQEAVKALGDMGSRRAVGSIKELFVNPPEIRQNAVFQNHCVDALVDILGHEACAWLQEQYPRTEHPVVADNIKARLKELGCP